MFLDLTNFLVRFATKISIISWYGFRPFDTIQGCDCWWLTKKSKDEFFHEVAQKISHIFGSFKAHNKENSLVLYNTRMSCPTVFEKSFSAFSLYGGERVDVPSKNTFALKEVSYDALGKSALIFEVLPTQNAPTRSRSVNHLEGLKTRITKLNIHPLNAMANFSRSPLNLCSDAFISGPSGRQNT